MFLKFNERMSWSGVERNDDVRVQEKALKRPFKVKKTSIKVYVSLTKVTKKKFCVKRVLAKAQ